MFATITSLQRGVKSRTGGSYQLLLAGQVRTFGVEVPQGSGAQLLLGPGLHHLGPGEAGEQQQCAEERSGAPRGADVRHGLELCTSQTAAPPPPPLRAQTPFI